MPSEVILPRVDMDMTTGKIAKWFVASGASVTKGQPLFEIETDKAAMEIEAPATGTIRDLAEASGTDIPVGSVVAWIFGEGEAEAAPKAEAPKAAPAAAPPAPAAAAAAEQAAAPQPARSNGAAPAVAPAPDTAEARPRATPMARRLARAAGIDLANLAGSGPRGRIQAADIAAAQPRAETRPTAAAVPVQAPPPADAPPADAPLAAAPLAAEPPRPAAPRPALAAPGASAGALNRVQLRDGQGRPTLLIHGFGSDANTWRPMLAGLGSDRPIQALDLPGHGASPLAGVASFAALVDAVEAALMAADLGPVDLVGHSLGGAVVGALAGRGTLDIRSALLVAPAGLGPAINGGFVEGFLRATTEASLTPWMRELVGDPAVLTPAFVRATLKAREGTGLVETQGRIAATMFPDGTQAFSIRADLARIAIPLRIVVGTADRIIPATQVDGLPGRIAVHRFPGVGHMPQLEIRDDIMAIMAELSR